MGNPIAFFEITSPDPDRARGFYTDLFGWSADPDPAMGGYAMVDTRAGEHAIGGGLGASGEGRPAGVIVYVRVDDLEASLATTEKLGGTKVSEPVELPGGFGRIAIVTDPDGNRLGLWA